MPLKTCPALTGSGLPVWAFRLHGPLAHKQFQGPQCLLLARPIVGASSWSAGVPAWSAPLLQLARAGLILFTGTRPGPKGPRKATGTLRARVLELRGAGHSVTEIAAACTAGGMPVSAQTVWLILDAEGLPRLPRRDDGRRGPPTRLDPVKAAALPGWPDGPVSLPCDHAGLLLLFPAICDTGLPDLISQAGYPSTRELSAWQSIGTLLLAKCARKPRVSHAGTLAWSFAHWISLGEPAGPADVDAEEV